MVSLGVGATGTVNTNRSMNYEKQFQENAKHNHCGKYYTQEDLKSYMTVSS